MYPNLEGNVRREENVQQQKLTDQEKNKINDHDENPGDNYQQEEIQISPEDIPHFKSEGVKMREMLSRQYTAPANQYQHTDKATGLKAVSPPTPTLQSILHQKEESVMAKLGESSKEKKEAFLKKMQLSFDTGSVQKNIPNQLNVMRNNIIPTKGSLFECKAEVYKEPLLLRSAPKPPAEFYNEQTSPIWRKECASVINNDTRQQNHLKMREKILYSYRGDQSLDKHEAILESETMYLEGQAHLHCDSLPQLQTSNPEAYPEFNIIDHTTKTYGVSAFFDIRNHGYHVLRVTTVTPFKDISLWCQFSCKEHPELAFTVKANPVYLGVMPMVDAYCIWQQQVYSCDVSMQCTPLRVAMTRTHCGKPESVMAIKTVGFPGKSPPKKVAICASTLFDFSDANLGDLVENIEANRMFGIHQLILYDTFNVSSNVESVLAHYEKQGYLKRIPWKIPKQIEYIFYFGQMLQYLDCIYRHMDDFSYTAMIDIDDIFVPASPSALTGTWNDLISLMSQNKVAGHLFLWITTCPSNETNPRGELSQELQLKTLQNKKIGPHNYHWKYVAEPRGIQNTHIHFPIDQYPGWGYIHQYHATGGFVYHYKKDDPMCEKNTQGGYIRTCDYLKDIQERTAQVLVDLELINTPSFLNQETIISSTTSTPQQVGQTKPMSINNMQNGNFPTDKLQNASLPTPEMQRDNMQNVKLQTGNSKDTNQKTTFIPINIVKVEQINSPALAQIRNAESQQVQMNTKQVIIRTTASVLLDSIQNEGKQRRDLKSPGFVDEISLIDKEIDLAVQRISYIYTVVPAAILILFLMIFYCKHVFIRVNGWMFRKCLSLYGTN